MGRSKFLVCRLGQMPTEVFSNKKCCNVSDGRSLCRKENKIDDVSFSFLEQMTRQLTPLLNDAVGKSVAKNFELHLFDSDNPAKSTFDYMKYVDGWTISPIYFTHLIETLTIWVKWRSLTGKEYVDLKDEVDENSIEFQLCTEEEQWASEYELYKRKLYPDGWAARVNEILSPSKTVVTANLSGISFDYEISCGWPDVILKVYFKNIPTDELIAGLDQTLMDFIEEWNKKQGKKGEDRFIHDIFQIENQDDENNVHTWYIDFGNCDSAVIIKLMECISNHVKGIEKIILT